MKNCPECSAVLDDNIDRCPYCGSDSPGIMDRSQMYSVDDRTALIKARIVIAAAIIALVINPLFITTLITSNSANKIRRSCNPNNKKVTKMCSVASTISGIAIFTSTIIFFAWLINSVIG